jgi:hypothetical protein
MATEELDAVAGLRDNLAIAFDGLQALEIAHRAQIDFERAAHASAARAAAEAREAATEQLRLRAFAAMASLRDLRAELEAERALRLAAQSEVSALREELGAGASPRRAPRALNDDGATQKALTLARRQLALQRAARLRAEAEADDLRRRLADAEAKCLRWETEVASLRRRIGPESERIRAEAKAKYEAALKEAQIPKELLLSMNRKMDYLVAEFDHDRQERHDVEDAARARERERAALASGGSGSATFSLELEHLHRRVNEHDVSIEGMSEGIRDAHESAERARLDLRDATLRAESAAADAIALGDEGAEEQRDRELGLDALITDLAESVKSAGIVVNAGPYGEPRRRGAFPSSPAARRDDGEVRHVRVGSPQSRAPRTSPARIRGARMTRKK